MKIYVASSWRNQYQPAVVEIVRGFGHEVYDFRNPRPGYHGFQWSDIDEAWQDWSIGSYIDSLLDPIAESGFTSDLDAMEWADAFILVMQCGRPAHLEAGWSIGAGKPTGIFLPPYEPVEPELMYLLADHVAPLHEDTLKRWIASVETRGEKEQHEH